MPPGQTPAIDAARHAASALADSPAVSRADPGSSPSVTTVRDAVIALLRRFAMTRIFGNPGSTELPLVRHFPPDFQYVLGLHEAVAVGMADGYAQATRNAAFVNLHSAAGVGNAMGNLFTAFKNRTPLVVTAGQQARAILPFEPFLYSQQAAELPRPYVKWSAEPARAEDVPLAIARAYYIAMQEPRGPVLVSIPADDWDRPAALPAERDVTQSTRPDPAALTRIGEALEASARPAFVVGAAVDRGGAWAAVQALAERHRARVFAAPMSGRCGFDESHRLFAGHLPALRERIVQLLAGHDLVFAIGAPAFTYHVDGQGPHLPPGAALVQLVDDPAPATWAPEGTAVVGGLRLGLEDLLARPAAAATTRGWPPRREPAPHQTPPPAGEAMSVAWVLQTLAELRGDGSVVVEEAPSARPVMQRHLPITRSEGFYTMCSGGLGWGLPAAVGVALARPGTKVIALIGDGSSLYSIQALWSAAQLKLPVTFVILNNRRYAALQDFAPVFGFGPEESVPGTDLHGIDFAQLARAQGMAGERITEAALLPAALAAALRSPEPMLLDIHVA